MLMRTLLSRGGQATGALAAAAILMLAILAAVSTETRGGNQVVALAADGIPGKGEPTGPGPTDPGPVQ
jgi:hypothetical protein